MKKKKLGTRITLAVMLVLAYGILSAGITGMVCLVNQSQSDMKSSMVERVSAASNLVSSTIQHYKSMIAALDGTTAQNDKIQASDPSIAAINTRAEGGEGVTISTDGYIVITAPYSKGMAYIATNADWLTSIMKTMHTSDSTEFYLLSADGSILADVNGSLDASQIAPYAGTNTVRTVTLGGEGRVIYDSQIIGTDWTVLVNCDASEFLASSTIALLIMIVTTAISFVVGVIVIRRYVKRIIVPLESINGKILDMSEGKLSGAPVEVYTGDELQTLAEAVNKMASYTGGIIKDIEAVAAKLAAEDLTAEPNAVYVGDYLPIQQALLGIVNSTSGVIRQIEASSRLVDDGSGKMSDNSTTLSQAATEQAATVEELNASIVEISSNISANADSAAKAKNLADDCRTIVDQGNVKMKDMLKAMEEINETSDQIANIIKTIEDISFQTNILSLNASIEAARAGEAGKGFAVVAGDVGQLAGKTAEAAKNTTALIKTSLAAVENGTVMANATAKMLDKIVKETEDTAQVIDQIAEASQEQADSVKQILVAMDQISTSIQMTSGSSAECAASAEELSGQAHVLLEMVRRFKLASPSEERKRNRRAGIKSMIHSDDSTSAPESDGAQAAPVNPDVTNAPVATESAEATVQAATDAPAAPTAPDNNAEKTPAPESKPAAKAEKKPEASKPAAKTEKKPEAPKPAAKAEKKPEAPKPAAKQEKKPEAPKSAAKQEKKPEAPKPLVTAGAPAAHPAPANRPHSKTIVLDDDKY